MCLMKPNYDIIGHIHYIRQINLKWINQLMEYTDIKSNSIKNCNYIGLMNYYKHMYDMCQCESTNEWITEQGINFTFEAMETINDYLESTYEQIKNGMFSDMVIDWVK